MMSTPAERVRRHRERMRAQGFRLVQLWLPDTRSADFRARCRAQSARIAADRHEAGLIDWVEQAADLEGWQ